MTMEMIAIYLLVAGGVILWYVIVSLLKAKKKESLAKEKVELQRAKLFETIRAERMKKRVDATEAFVDMVRSLVQDQVYGRLQLLEVLKQPYPIRELDNDIKVMSDKVFKSISTSAYKAPDNILSEDAIMNYIIEQVTTILTASSSEYNAKVYAQAADLQ